MPVSESQLKTKEKYLSQTDIKIDIFQLLNLSLTDGGAE